jgi:hypothetical protein
MLTRPRVNLTTFLYPTIFTTLQMKGPILLDVHKEVNEYFLKD